LEAYHKNLGKVPSDQELELKVGKEYVSIQLSQAINTRVEPDPEATLNHLDAEQGKEPSFVQIWPARNLLKESSPRPMVPPLPHDPPTETSIMDAMEKKWSTGVEHFSEALWICSPSTFLPCSIKGITIEAHLNPSMEVNIMPWHLVYTLLGNMMLRPSDKLLKSCLFGHILKCQGVACAVPLLVDKIKVNLDFHIFDVLDLDLLLGSHIEKLLDAPRGSLDKKLWETVFAITPLFSENAMVTPLPKQNPFKEMMHVSPLASSKPVLAELVEFSISQEFDSEDQLHLCEAERSSLPLIDFEPFPTGLYHVASDRGRESTLFIHDASLEIGNSWAVEIYKALTLGLKERISSRSMVALLLNYLRNHACIISLQSQPRSVHRAHIRTTTALWFSFVRSL
jgi:hypothetical protein